jgi:hypothetical protein
VLEQGAQHGAALWLELSIAASSLAFERGERDQLPIIGAQNLGLEGALDAQDGHAAVVAHAARRDAFQGKALEGRC